MVYPANTIGQNTSDEARLGINVAVQELFQCGVNITNENGVFGFNYNRPEPLRYRGYEFDIILEKCQGPNIIFYYKIYSKNADTPDFIEEPDGFISNTRLEIDENLFCNFDFYGRVTWRFYLHKRTMTYPFPPS
jgi:hypothetical protein